MKKEKNNEWYNSGNIITTLIISVILLIVVVSQSYANGSLSISISSIINHNSFYLLILVYFILLKFKVGKRYFNYLNLFLMFIYCLACVTSFITVIQSFSINTFLAFVMYFYFLIYLVHIMLRDTSVWKDYKLYNSPFNEFDNEWMFYGIIVLAVVSLSVNLISTVILKGVILSLLDSAYYLLFGRYIYLYGEYLDMKKINVDNKGNFDEVREFVGDVIDDTKTGIKEALDKTTIDDTIVEIKDKVVDAVDGVINKDEEKVDKEQKKVKTTSKKKSTSKSKKEGSKE